MTTIASINGLPCKPCCCSPCSPCFPCPTCHGGIGTVCIVITSGIPSFFKVEGIDLDRIVKVDWYPERPSSVKWHERGMILLDDTIGTFMIQVVNNYLDICNRAGKVSFRLDDGTTLTLPAQTYGRVSIGPLWQAPEQGLMTG
jgi:hypothetical protein